MDDVLARLRDAILRGEFAPRQRLIETEPAERYPVSLPEHLAVVEAHLTSVPDALSTYAPAGIYR